MTHLRRPLHISSPRGVDRDVRRSLKWADTHLLLAYLVAKMRDLPIVGTEENVVVVALTAVVAGGGRRESQQDADPMRAAVARRGHRRVHDVGVMDRHVPG